MSRATGKDGKLYGIKYGEAIVGGVDEKIPKDGWYKIKSMATTGTGIPSKAATAEGGASLTAGYVYFAKKDQILIVGDVVIPLEIEMISFVTDVSDSAQASPIDTTTQADMESGTRSYVPGAFKERSGSINGLVDSDSKEQLELVKEFKAVVVSDGESVTLYKSKTRVHEYMLSRFESETAGQTEIWEYFPVIVESLQMDKPMDGAQPFSFNYRVDGASKPAIYYNKVAS